MSERRNDGAAELSEFGRQMRHRTLLGRFGHPDNIANGGLRPVSDESSYPSDIDLVVGDVPRSL